MGMTIQLRSVIGTTKASACRRLRWDTSNRPSCMDRVLGMNRPGSVSCMEERMSNSFTRTACWQVVVKLTMKNSKRGIAMQRQVVQNTAASSSSRAHCQRHPEAALPGRLRSYWAE